MIPIHHYPKWLRKGAGDNPDIPGFIAISLPRPVSLAPPSRLPLSDRGKRDVPGIGSQFCGSCP